LGIKIVKDVVDVHGGQIHVESEVGVGTTFYMHLPVQPPPFKE
jgi:signal transduction histidine kinase